MATKKAETITIPALDIKNVTLRIVGDAPLICHAWSKKAKMDLLNKHLQKATKAREIRRPAVEFADSLYWLTEKPNLDGLTDEEAQAVLAEYIPKSKFGFPALAFKSAAIDGAFQQKVVDKKTTARGAIRVGREMTELEGIPEIREDAVRIGISQTNLCYRAEFKTWATDLKLQYNIGAISLEQIVNIFNIGGFSNGVGDWRPAKDGANGTFHVEAVKS